MRKKRIILLVITILGMAMGAWADPVVTLTLTPTGAIAGGTGDAVGWGYTITTDSDYIFIDYFFFDEVSPVGSLDTSVGVPSTFASAGSPLIVPFTENLSGLQYLITSDVLGAESIGTMIVHYDACTDDTQSDCLFDQTASAMASVTVNSVPPPPSNVPEPATVGMLSIGLALLSWRYGRWQQSSSEALSQPGQRRS